MNRHIRQGFIAGSIGAIILVIIMYILRGIGLGEPGFVLMYRGAFGENHQAEQLISALIFIISGGFWGIAFALLIKNPNILKGFLFGILPTLWLWIVVNAFLHKPLFNDFQPMGIIMPIVFNMVIWGSFVGWYLKGKFK